MSPAWRVRALKAARRLLHPLGVDLVRYRPTATGPGRRQQWLDAKGIDLVLDVGANVGQYARELRANGYGGGVISFEPLSSAFAELQRRSAGDPCWETRRIALADRPGQASLNVSHNSYSSSLLPMAERHLASAPDSRYQRSEQVEVQRLDDCGTAWLEGTQRLLLKLDVQGFEDKVLDGGARTLARCELVECELSFVPLYQGQPLFAEMLGRFQSAGFGLLAIEPGLADPRTGVLLQVDGLFGRQAPGAN